MTGPVAFSDDFDRADGSLGASWQSYTGAGIDDLVIQATHCTMPVDAAVDVYQTVSAAGPWTDAWAECQVNALPPASNVALLLRADAPSGATQPRYYACYLGGPGVSTPPVSDVTIQLYRVSATSPHFQQLTPDVSLGATPTFPLVVRFEAVGPVLRGYINNVAKITASDATLTTGAAGLEGYITSPAPIGATSVDYFRCGPLAGIECLFYDPAAA
jgi:hypothetical protein